MLKTTAVIALSLLLSVDADAGRERLSKLQSQPLCGRCLELDNETLPDKHYFPPIDDDGAAQQRPQAFMFESAAAISAHLWNGESPHATHTSEFTVIRPTGSGSDKHGEPSLEPAAVDDAEWAWGGLRECNRGPEGKITAGCHEAQYDNLLCNSHYDDCDDEMFAMAVHAVQSGDATTLRSLIGHAGSTVVLNRKRESIQLIGCSGDIVGNLPVSKELLRSIQ